VSEQFVVKTSDGTLYGPWSDPEEALRWANDNIDDIGEDIVVTEVLDPYA